MTVELDKKQNVRVTNPAVNIPVSILYKSIAGRYRPVRVTDGPITARYRFIKNATDGPITARYRFIKNASWDNFGYTICI